MRRLLAATLCLCCVGCSSISDMAAGDGGQRVFGGTRRNASMIEGELIFTHVGTIEVIIGMCDFPFSLALDTVFFPVTLVFAIARSGH